MLLNPYSQKRTSAFYADSFGMQWKQLKKDLDLCSKRLDHLEERLDRLDEQMKEMKKLDLSDLIDRF